MTKYDYSRLMKRAWQIFRKGKMSFGEALRRSWISEKAAGANAETIEAARIAAGISEECRTWYGWKAAGREVEHESTSLFKAVIIDGATKSGSRILSFFGFSQTREAEQAA